MSENLPYETEQEKRVCKVLSDLIGVEVEPWQKGTGFSGGRGFSKAVAPNLENLPNFTVPKEYTERIDRLRKVEARAIEFYRAINDLDDDERVKFDGEIRKTFRGTDLASRESTISDSADDVRLGVMLALEVRKACPLSDNSGHRRHFDNGGFRP